MHIKNISDTVAIGELILYSFKKILLFALSAVKFHNYTLKSTKTFTTVNFFAAAERTKFAFWAASPLGGAH